MFIPYRVDVPMYRWPISNFVIIGLTVAAFFLQESVSEETLMNLILSSHSPWLGLFGHMFLHLDIIHLIGNTLFLWVFGNAVCSKIGNLWYPLLYIGLGVASGAVHLLLDGRPAVGASGAVNGVVGAFLVFYPLNDLSCILLLFVHVIRFSISSIWMILLWLMFDIWGAASGGVGIAYFGHVGGFAAGFGLATLALRLKWTQMEPAERSLFDVLAGRAKPKRFRRPEKPDAPPRELPPRGPSSMVDMLSAKNAQTARPPSAPAATQQDSVMLRCVCGKRLRASRSLCGKRVRCPACSQVVEVPKA